MLDQLLPEPVEVAAYRWTNSLPELPPDVFAIIAILTLWTIAGLILTIKRNVCMVDTIVTTDAS